MNPSEAKLLNLLKSLKKTKASSLSKKMGLDKGVVGRIAYGLSEKGLIKIDKLETNSFRLTKEGRDVKKNGTPERKLLGELPKPLKDIQNHIALNWALKLKWVEIKRKKVVPVLKDPPKTQDEILLEKSGKLTDDEALLLKKRKWVEKKKSVDYVIEITESGEKIKVEKKVTQVTPDMLMGGKWKSLTFQEFSPNTPTPENYAGRYHPLTDTIEKVRQVFLEMGFTEAKGKYITNSFWCFDALFVPQDHPAREMQDTFYLGSEEGLPDIADKVAEVHKKYWGAWDEKEAKKQLLRTHTTAVSAKLLTEIEPPAKIFQVGRNFRNETVDYKHGAEFYQVEGIVVDENVNFNNLVGYLRSFFAKLGLDKIRIRPGYFPYTEMSAEVDVWFKPKNSWMELGGAGIFRPEVVKPLLGKDIPVLAWGLGLERIAMMNYGMKDFRELYRSSLKTLRNRRSLI